MAPVSAPRLSIAAWLAGWQAVNLGWSYFAMLWNYVDCALIAMGLAAVMFGVISGLATTQIKSKAKHLDTYQDFYTLAAARYKFDVAVAGVLFLGWIKVRHHHHHH